MKGGHLGIDLGSGFVYHLKFSLNYGMGIYLLGVSLLSLIYLIFNRNKQIIILLVNIALFYFFMGKGKSVFMRYMLPVIPFLCVTSAIFLAGVSDMLKISDKTRAALLFVAVILLVLNPLTRTIRTNELLAEKDTRVIASGYIQSNIRQGSNIMLTSYFGAPMLYQSVELLRKEYDALAAAAPNKSYKKLKMLIDLTAQRQLTSYNIYRVTKAPSLEKSELPYEITKRDLVKNNIEYVVLNEYYFEYYEAPDSFKKLIKENGELVMTILPMNSDDVTEPVLDPIDLFYLPVDNLEGFNRPGPVIRIYKMRLT